MKTGISLFLSLTSPISFLFIAPFSMIIPFLLSSPLYFLFCTKIDILIRFPTYPFLSPIPFSNHFHMINPTMIQNQIIFIYFLLFSSLFYAKNSVASVKQMFFFPYFFPFSKNKNSYIAFYLIFAQIKTTR